ncbi:hypothetical protein [Flavobacterium sp.]
MLVIFFTTSTLKMDIWVGTNSYFLANISIVVRSLKPSKTNNDTID